MTYLKLRTGIEEYFAAACLLLPLQQYGDAEEEVAQPAFAVAGGFVACGEEAFSISFQQGIVAVDVE